MDEKNMNFPDFQKLQNKFEVAKFSYLPNLNSE